MRLELSERNSSSRAAETRNKCYPHPSLYIYFYFYSATEQMFFSCVWMWMDMSLEVKEEHIKYLFLLPFHSSSSLLFNSIRSFVRPFGNHWKLYSTFCLSSFSFHKQYRRVHIFRKRCFRFHSNPFLYFISYFFDSRLFYELLYIFIFFIFCVFVGMTNLLQKVL